MLSVVGRKTEEFVDKIKETDPDIYYNIEYTLEYLKLHNSNKNIYDNANENGLICTMKKGVCNLLEVINILENKNDTLQTDKNNLIENNNNIEKEYIKMINKNKNKNNKRKRSEDEDEDEDEDDSNICEICYELDKNILLNCGHKFCGVCLIKINNKNCPMCRTEITSKIDII